MRKTESGAVVALRILVTIVVFLLAAWGIFELTDLLIDWITSGIDSHDTRGIARVILWCFGFVFTLLVALFVGLFAGKFVNLLLGGK